MFCNYCGKPNPDDASFCNTCGKPLNKPRLQRLSPSSEPEPKPVPIVKQSVAARREPVQTTPIVTESVKVEAPPRASPGPAKKRSSRSGWILVGLVVLAALLYPLRYGVGVCDAVRLEIVQQVPTAMDILTARYPLLVGVMRAMFNNQEFVDNFAVEFISSTMEANQKNPSATSCYVVYYFAMFDKERVQTMIAEMIEKRLGLK